MTKQFADIIKKDKRKYSIAGATDFNAILDIKKYGFEPKCIGTACYKGFVIELAIVNDILQLDYLVLVDNNLNYPIINNVEPVLPKYASGIYYKHFKDVREYNNIGLELNYTGHIYATEHSLPLEGRMFWEDQCSLEECIDLCDFYFEDGILISFEKHNKN